MQILRERTGRILAQSEGERNCRSNYRGGTRKRREDRQRCFYGHGRTPRKLAEPDARDSYRQRALAPQIKKLAEESLQVRLAVSLHGATDAIRNQIMPINRRYNIETLLSACDYYVARKKQRLTFEYILIAGVNDADDQANLLAQHARRLSAKVNLIPYNTVEGLEWSRPSRSRQEKFLSILRARGVAATLRHEKGHDINAACGQLRLQTEREDVASSSRRRRHRQDVRVTI
jgi:hypothetical protein